MKKNTGIHMFGIIIWIYHTDQTALICEYVFYQDGGTESLIVGNIVVVIMCFVFVRTVA